MKSISRLAAIALSVAGVAGSVALAQTTLDPKQPDNPDTANYSLFPGSNLKRDGSLGSPEVGQPVTRESATDTSRTWTTTTTTTSTTANAAPVESAPVAAAPAQASTDTTVAEASPPPRADRN